MPRVERRLRIAASRSEVWMKLTAFAEMPRWFLGVRRVELATAPGEGAQRVLTLVTRQSMRERIFDWSEEKGFSLEVLDPPPLSHDWLCRIELESQDDATLIRWVLRWRSRFGAAGWLLHCLLVKPVVDVALVLSLRRLRSQLGSATQGGAKR